MMYRKSEKIVDSFMDKYEFDNNEINKLCSLANSSNSEIRRRVAVILGGISDKKVEKALYHLSFDKDNIVKLEAVDSLAICKSQLSLQRLKQVCHSNDPYLRFFAIQSYCDVFLNMYEFEYACKKELLKMLSEYEQLETDCSVLAVIHKCKAVCDDKQSVFSLIQMHTKAVEEGNFHLITPTYNLLSELNECLEDEDTLKIIDEYLHRYENEK